MTTNDVLRRLRFALQLGDPVLLGIVAASKDGSPGSSTGVVALDNNMILKKIRIALQLKEEDMMAIMRLSGIELSKNEPRALFQTKDHRNQKECMDQFLRNFLAGLPQYTRAT